MPVTVEYQVLADTTKADRQMRKFAQNTERNTGRVAGGFAKMGKGIALALGVVGVREVARFASDMSKLGAQVEAYGVKSTAVFKEQRAQIQAWSEDNRRNFGIGRAELEGMITEVGQMLAASGFAGEELAGLSLQVAEMAGNASLLSGGTVSMTDALGKFTALLRGERDPIESLGVSIKQSDLNARLAADGLNELTGEARKQAEAIASIEMAQEQLADQMAATGEIGGGAARALQSDWATLQEELGTIVYEFQEVAAPAVLDFLNGLRGIETLGGAGEFGAGIRDGVHNIRAALAGEEIETDNSIENALYDILNLKGDLSELEEFFWTSLPGAVTHFGDTLSSVTGDADDDWDDMKERVAAWERVVEEDTGTVKYLLENRVSATIKNVHLDLDEMGLAGIEAFGDLESAARDSIPVVAAGVGGALIGVTSLLAHMAVMARAAFDEVTLGASRAVAAASGIALGEVNRPRPAVPGYTGAMGGIVPGARGEPVPVLLHGGETVLPTHLPGGGSTGGGNTYNVTVSAPASSPADVGEAIVEAIEEYEKFGGTGWRA